MKASSDIQDPVDLLAEEFAARYRRGERPSVGEYADRYPDHAESIRELFPALVVLEQLKPAADEATLVKEHDPTLIETPAPERLGDFRIVRELGRGGMGVVYEAVQESLGRPVALKVLAGSAFGGQNFLQRFEREAQAAAKLHHTNIVPVYGVGRQDGVCYYAMQLINGQGLDRIVTGLRAQRKEAVLAEVTNQARTLIAPASSLTAGTAAAVTAPNLLQDLSQIDHGDYYRQVARMCVQVAEALAHAHQQGVLHRDIKPSNLLLDAQGTVWVTDFGLAKGDENEALTGTGEIVGTLRYMAPERFNGRSLPQGDLYSFGLTFYELLTLRPAFDDADQLRLIDKVLREPPRPPRQLNGAIPRDLETIVLKCLAKEPRERYATAADAAEYLRRFLDDRPILARRHAWHERAWRWCRRNPAVATLSAAVLLLLVAVAVVSILFAARWNQERNDAVINARRAVVNAQRAEEAEREVRQAYELIEFYRTIRPDPRYLSAFRGKNGNSYYFHVKGTVGEGGLWGTDVYSDDSLLALAAVHAGVLQPGQQGVVKVTILPGQARYQGSLRHGIRSEEYADFGGSYRVEPLDRFLNVNADQLPAMPPPIPWEYATRLNERQVLQVIGSEAGQVLNVQVTGNTMGTVWGDGIYTNDSSIAAAAVHCGLVKAGETAELRLTVLPGQVDYRGATRHGVQSLDYGKWDLSYRLERVKK